MGRWDGAGGASHSGCVGSVGGMGKGGSCGGGCGTLKFWFQEGCTQRKCLAVR